MQRAPWGAPYWGGIGGSGDCSGGPLGGGCGGEVPNEEAAVVERDVKVFLFVDLIPPPPTPPPLAHFPPCKKAAPP